MLSPNPHPGGLRGSEVPRSPVRGGCGAGRYGLSPLPPTASSIGTRPRSRSVAVETGGAAAIGGPGCGAAPPGCPARLRIDDSAAAAPGAARGRGEGLAAPPAPPLRHGAGGGGGLRAAGAADPGGDGAILGEGRSRPRCGDVTAAAAPSPGPTAEERGPGCSRRRSDAFGFPLPAPDGPGIPDRCGVSPALPLPCRTRSAACPARPRGRALPPPPPPARTWTRVKARGITRPTASCPRARSGTVHPSPRKSPRDPSASPRRTPSAFTPHRSSSGCCERWTGQTDAPR